MNYSLIPHSITNVNHSGSAFPSVNFVNAVTDFSTAGSMSAGSVEVSKSTGELNFSSLDLTSYSGEAITSTSVINLEGEYLTKYLARQVISAIRNYWRTDVTFKPLFYPQIIQNIPVNNDEDLGVYRRMIELRVQMFNIWEGI